MGVLEDSAGLGIMLWPLLKNASAAGHHGKVNILKWCIGKSITWESENLVLSPASAQSLLTARMGLSVFICKVGDTSADPTPLHCGLCPPSAGCRLDAQ